MMAMTDPMPDAGAQTGVPCSTACPAAAARGRAWPCGLWRAAYLTVAAVLWVGMGLGPTSPTAWASGPKMSTAPVAAKEIRGISVTGEGAGVAAAMRESRRGRRASADGMARGASGGSTVSRRYPELIQSGRLIELVNRYSGKYGVDPRLVYSLIEQESRFNRLAVSPKGAQGLMQIMPDTQRYLGLSDPFDEEKNIDAGIRYLRAMLDRFQTEVMALAAYNAGPEAVARHNGVPPYDETKDYVLKVVDRYFFLRLKYPSGNIGEIAQAEAGL
ncbi:lytic transglycosylase domain-containing protein [Desulfolutivibrio sulfoxidireducens]|uniref:lytic transglycosylase domain-containing protein n=1 Tax=Desulfolutivibrio sulfoxidireducens TaxID=2773299 RepID=UPI0023EBB5EE|nr:lytic transglycosylase domain-containing protein [Desulfolutivibrio sulfoxidireducens]